MTPDATSLRRPDGGRWCDLGGAVLLAGDVRNVPDMQRIVAALSPEAHATVLVEVDASMGVCVFEAPDAVRVSWLDRSIEGELRPRGERLAAAIHAWCAEWACGEAPVCTVWLGARTPSRIVRMTRALLPEPRVS
ncbi:SIP domain-containing protein [Microbacterium trichothecenolyticum]|uniref:NADPH-dependent ferric siderophore reductase n=1 Tax=Microbacterium trichothecenolyticum TaxID=69370 RepID=A0ABU0TYG0_MICTR|nr:SIP domain-containing protein [Microbacterium trichothecenolyticum]MDQ1124679.1 NADPH-dependent ferric siderophore reductase [Microbacterium trichothecenolyticum]